jgi:hypothetical protein
MTAINGKNAVNQIKNGKNAAILNRKKSESMDG